MYRGREREREREGEIDKEQILDHGGAQELRVFGTEVPDSLLVC